MTDNAEPSVDNWADTVRAERERQASKGYDATHDREHGVRHLLNWAIDYARRGEAVKSSALILAAMDLLTEPGPVDALAPENREYADPGPWTKEDHATYNRIRAGFTQGGQGVD